MIISVTHHACCCGLVAVTGDLVVETDLESSASEESEEERSEDECDDFTGASRGEGFLLF